MAGHQTRTQKFQGRVNSPEALERLRAVLAQFGEIHDACLYQHRLLRFRRQRRPQSEQGDRRIGDDPNQAPRRAAAPAGR